MTKHESIPVTLDTLRRINWGHNYNPTILDVGEDYFEKYRFDFDFENKTMNLWGVIDDYHGRTSTHFIHSYNDWAIYNELQNVI